MMDKTKEQLLDELVQLQKAQIKNYEGLSETNDKIIEKQREYITKLETLLAESKKLLEESLSLLKTKNKFYETSI